MYFLQDTNIRIPIAIEIVRLTPTQLLLRVRPIYLWLVGIFVAIAALYLIISYRYEVEQLWLLYLLLGGWLVLTFLFLISSEVITCRFDKVLGMMTLKQKTLLGTKVTKYPLWEIRQVGLDKLVSSYRVVILFHNGNYVFLPGYYSSEKKTKQHVVLSIAKFLNIEALFDLSLAVKS
ncbi:MAG: hypothetical protein SAL07_06660 [Oscillatoria sp. PMC 1051.18]|nr:hypothetical protein [Oscillatoria sp. PMC 1050.18]MEC5029577.1 hypothetical protein [Oscillatoria sp. PMC 1051.18]